MVTSAPQSASCFAAMPAAPWPEISITLSPARIDKPSTPVAGTTIVGATGTADYTDSHAARNGLGRMLQSPRLLRVG